MAIIDICCLFWWSINFTIHISQYKIPADCWLYLITARSASVDSKSELVLSRRQILASLEEERSPGWPSSPSPSSSQSSTYAWTPSSSSPRSPSLEEPVFSRACLLQSISKEEDWGTEPTDRWEQTILIMTSSRVGIEQPDIAYWIWITLNRDWIAKESINSTWKVKRLNSMKCM